MSAPPLPVLHQRYTILAKLGQGRLAAVYRARDERLQRAVLVHLLRQELVAQPSLRQRFQDEAQRAAQRSHPGLLDVYDSGEVAGRPYMVTEDITGRPLAELLPLPPVEGLSVLRTIASAVALAQSQGSPHPPISSQNVWLAEGGRAILLENWLLAPQAAALDLAHYRAPERARGAPPSPATVVYALGILSWETLAGRRPFTGPTPDAIAERQLRELLPVLSDIIPRLFAPGLDRVIASAAIADPHQRYPTPTDFGRALDLYVDQATAQTGRLAMLPQPQPETSKGRMRMFRRGTTGPAPAVPPPPPAPILRETPRMQRRPAPPPMPAVPVDQQAGAQQAPRVRWWDRRRKQLKRSIVKRSIQIALILGLIYAALAGIDYATRRARALDPGGWIARRVPRLPDLSLPDFSWLDRLPRLRDIVGGVAGSRQLVVIQPVNLRPEASTREDPLRALEEGTRLRQIGGPVDDLAGLPRTWIKVIVVEDGTEGWVAEQPDRIRAE